MRRKPETSHWGHGRRFSPFIKKITFPEARNNLSSIYAKSQRLLVSS
jgi:hypothetical protein